MSIVNRSEIRARTESEKEFKMLKPYYQDEYCTIYNADCHEVLPQLEPVDLVLTDPPYGIKRFVKGIGNGDRMKNKSCCGFNNNVPTKEFFETLIKLSKESIFWGMNNFELPCTEHFLVWDKEQTVDNFASAELAWCNISKPAKVFRYSIHQHNPNKFGGHPTEKPLLLFIWCVALANNPQTVLDPFMGSGTTLRAAKDLGRKAIGIEIEKKYCDIAIERLRQEVLAL